MLMKTFVLYSLLIIQMDFDIHYVNKQYENTRNFPGK
jgi:hypothetical protein